MRNESEGQESSQWTETDSSCVYMCVCVSEVIVFSLASSSPRKRPPYDRWYATTAVF